MMASENRTLINVYNLSTSALFHGVLNNTDNATFGVSVVTTLASLPISTRQYAINITYILVAIFGVCGNLLSLTVICTHPPIRKRLPNYYFINQTIADLLVSILLIPGNTVGLIPYGYSTILLCYLWQSRAIFVGVFDVSVYCIAALSVERYLEVVYPIWHKLNVTKVKVIVTIVVIWILAILYRYAYSLPPTRAVNGVCIIAAFYPSTFASSLGGLINWFIEFLFPLSLILFCYIQMWRALRNKVGPPSGPITVTVSSGTKSTNTSMSRVRKNILTTLVIIAAFFIVCNTYKQILVLLKYLSIIVWDSTSMSFNISQILAFMNATIEPYIYLIYHREFQIGFRKLFKCGVKRTDNDTSQTNASSAH